MSLCKVFFTFTLYLETFFMETGYLFQHKYKKVGWFLFFIGVLAGLSYYIFELQELEFFEVNIFTLFNDSFLNKTNSFSISKDNILNEIIAIFLILGALLVAFSKTKSEDELVIKLRMESLVLATYLNYVILVLAILFTYGFVFFEVMVFNLFTILIFFVIIFHYKLYKLNK